MRHRPEYQFLRFDAFDKAPARRELRQGVPPILPPPRLQDLSCLM